MSLIQEQRVINNYLYYLTYSSLDHYIQKDGKLYATALDIALSNDPIILQQTYVETNKPIPSTSNEIILKDWTE